MINLTRLNSQEIIVNACHIVTVESTPDTVVTLFGGEKLMVLETPTQIIDLVVSFLRRIAWMRVLSQPKVEERLSDTAPEPPALLPDSST